MSLDILFDSEWYLSRSKESDNQGIKVHAQKIFKSYSFLSQEKNKKTGRFSLKFFWTPSASVQQVPQPLISKSMSPYSVASSFSTPRSGSTKWQTKIITYYLSALRLLERMCPLRWPLHKIRYENWPMSISKRFEFLFCLHEKVILGRPEISSV